MHSSITRRSFLTRSCGLSLAGIALAGSETLQAITPIERTGAARLLLSVAAYSFRDSFRDSTHQQAGHPKQQIDLFQFIDYCADHGCLGTELTSYYFPADFTDEFLL